MNIYKTVKYQVSKLSAFLFPTERQRNVINWITEDGEKLRYRYNLNSDSLVFDIGGYKGQWASDIYSMYNCRIIIIEPQIEFFKNIQERFIYNSKVEVYPIALGSNKREELISFDADASSVFISTNSKKELMSFEDVFDFFKKHNLSNVDLMKINIEGGEYELLTRLIDSGIVRNIKNLQIQFHDFVPNANVEMKKIQSQLLQTHRTTFQYTYVWENWELK
jgi:FkbM family methyltransferase